MKPRDSLHRADQADFRALTDIGIAAMRVGRASATEESLQKYEEALGFPAESRRTHKDLMLDMNTAFSGNPDGEILHARGRQPERARATSGSSLHGGEIASGRSEEQQCSPHPDRGTCEAWERTPRNGGSDGRRSNFAKSSFATPMKSDRRMLRHVFKL